METMMNIRLVDSSGNNGHICLKFIELLKQSEALNCDNCPHENDFDACSSTDCTIDVPVCEDYACPKNHFYHALNWKKSKPTIVTRLTRNCLHGIALISGPLVLADIANMYGLTRERVRQLEFYAMVKFGKLIQKEHGVGNLLHVRSMAPFQKLIAKKARWDQRHVDMRVKKRKEKLREVTAR